MVLLLGTLKNVYGQPDKEVPVASDRQNGVLNAATPALPMPSGQFGIGRIGYEWIDTSRADTYSATPDAHRDLMVYLWYPTPRTDSGRMAPYLPGARQMAANSDVQRRVEDEFGASWEQIVSGAIVSHAVENAPAAKSPNGFPIVLFSHGLGSMGFAYTSLIEDLVSHGYVVASIEHTYKANGGCISERQSCPVLSRTHPRGPYTRATISTNGSFCRTCDH